MKVTKYTHACLVLEEQGQQLVIDPGSWSFDLPTDITNVSGIVITHIHGDHFDMQKVLAIMQANPGAQIWTTAETARQLTDKVSSNQLQIAASGHEVKCGVFTVQFFGEQHAFVYQDKPKTQNIGVLINNDLYYPGDSFTVPNVPVVTLALPISGPWLKTDESLVFLTTIKPKRLFATHDALLSEQGVSTTNAWVALAANEMNIEFLPVQPGETIDLG